MYAQCTVYCKRRINRQAEKNNYVKRRNSTKKLKKFRCDSKFLETTLGFTLNVRQSLPLTKY